MGGTGLRGLDTIYTSSLLIQEGFTQPIDLRGVQSCAPFRHKRYDAKNNDEL
jgi:hypothetical protein